MPVTGPSRRPRIIDDHLPQIEQWVERSKGRVRADIVHERLLALCFDGTEHATRRAVAEAKAAWRAGHHRTYRPGGYLPRVGESPNPGCGCNSTGVKARKYPERAEPCARRCCSAPGWPGHATGW
ncbi:putative transposase [Rhodococcus opacus B4]|uniref:Putative transposase n=1 Tax=Rhodococcus opacus (strain B4) TaxID=632772 RepID=C1ASI3_RHOOB|nr:putative transposase [Rhodococcus opacus B4]